MITIVGIVMIAGLFTWHQLRELSQQIKELIAMIKEDRG